MTRAWRQARGARSAALAVLALSLAANSAFADPLASRSGPYVVAQLLAPPGDVPDAGDDQGGDTAALLLRIGRLENDLRRATGAIEELQNQNQKLAEELKRFREDVEFRLSNGKAPLASAAPPPVAAPPTVRKSDAFDPNAAPTAPGAPQQLGTTQPSAPLDLTPRVAETPPPAAAPAGPLKPNDSGPTVIGSGLDFADGPRGQFNAALEAYKAGQYDAAEQQFRAFLAANAGNRLTADAVFYLGETYLQRSRPREAAEQYLKLSTDYAKSSRAPEAMMRLGQSLALLGNTEQACATFAEVSHRYPAASPVVKKTVDREMQKDRC